jgi:hypothetical protein
VVLAQVVRHQDFDIGVIHWWWWLLGLVVLALLVTALVSLLRERPVGSEPLRGGDDPHTATDRRSRSALRTRAQNARRSG